jgi:3-keto steroid reductase
MGQGDAHKVMVITGGNGPLGLSIAKKLMKEVDQAIRLTLVITSRRFASAKDALKELTEFSRSLERNVPVEFDYLLFDQTDMVSVFGAATELKQRYSHIDCIFLHSSYPGFIGISLKNFVRDFCKDPIKTFSTGETMKIQERTKIGSDGMTVPFEANIFAPWFMINELIPLLSNGGKVVYFSSSIATADYFSRDNIPLVDHDHAYEACKYEMECLQRATYKKLLDEHGVETWIMHPGVFVSNQTVYATITLWMTISAYVMFYICRWCGSQDHTIYPELSAHTPVWMALEADKTKDDMAIKYGSGSDRWGRPVVQKHRTYLDDNDVTSVYSYVEGLRKEWKEKLKGQIVARKNS